MCQASRDHPPDSRKMKNEKLFDHLRPIHLLWTSPNHTRTMPFGMPSLGGDGRSGWSALLIGSAVAGTTGIAYLMARSAGLLHRVCRDTTRNFGVVITGSSRGLGRAMAHQFLSLGDRVVIASRNKQAVDDAVRALAAAAPPLPSGAAGSPRVVGVVCDVRDTASVEALATEAVKQLGRIDIWVNNAAVTQAPKAAVAETPPSTLRAVVETNLLGTLYGSRAAMRQMSQQGTGGSVFNVDGAGSRGRSTANSAVYGATKAAIPQLTRSLAREGRDARVGVHAVSPGMVTTDLLLSSGARTRPGALKIFNILAEKPETAAAWLVPRMRGLAAATGPNKAPPSSAYVSYLTPPGVVWRFATAPFRSGRIFSREDIAKAAAAAKVEAKNV